MEELELYNQKTFEDLKHLTEDGVEYWYARELMAALGYSKWGNFIKVINKAKSSAETTNINIFEHFADVGRVLKVGNGAKMEVTDIMLSRYACYLIVQNGDPRKKMIALGQQYFAIQTRKQELSEKQFNELSEDERRLVLRGDVTDFNKKLFKAAQDCGVENYGTFNNAGYMGLYGGETAEDIKKRKGLKKSENILDNMGSTELAANLFRITQTEERLNKGDIVGQNNANITHYTVGAIVRETIEKINQIIPEKLPTPEKSIKELKKEKKKLENKSKKAIKN